MQITKILLIFLFFTLPLVHGGILATLGIDFKLIVSGNFEFTKSIYFNILSSLILISFLIDSFFEKKPSSLKSSEYWIILLVSIILISSTVFSLSPFTSMIGDDNKGHTALLFFNLLGIFVVLRNFDTHFLSKLIWTSLLSGIGVSLIAMKELFSPTFNYGHLADRALGSFGHPNYFAGYLLLLLPLTQTIKAHFEKFILILILGIGILLSKSIVAVVLAFLYITFSGIFYIYKKKKLHITPLFWKTGLIGSVIAFGILLTFVTLYLPEKLHSFLSRFYLWETTLAIIFSNWKIFLFGGGPETLSYVFESFKSPEVYIYENFGFTADRPHNFFLNIFYHFGVLGLGMLTYLVFTFLSLCKRDKVNCKAREGNLGWYPKGEGLLNTCRIVIILFLLFGIIHFFSVASYLVVMLTIIYLVKTSQTPPQEESLNRRDNSGIVSTLCLGTLALISLIGAYYSSQFYSAERLYAQKDYAKAQETFSHPKYLLAEGLYDHAEKIESLYSSTSYKGQIKSFPEKETHCKVFIEEYPSPENYFYCGNILEGIGNTELSLEYYTQGLSLLPNLWKEDSPYWDNYFIKNTITGNRFFSEKFGDIRGVLKKVEK